MQFSPVEHLLSRSLPFSRLSAEDRSRLAVVAQVRDYEKGEVIFRERDEPSLVHTILTGRVKLVKARPGGKEIILEILGPGDPLGTVAAYESRPYPATAIALEAVSALALKRAAFFDALETCPTLVRGLLAGLSLRIVDLTHRLSEVTATRIETRFALLLIKLADRIGVPGEGGVLIPLPLSRQELADLVGTTVETAIRTLSRWSKEGIVATEKEGFRILDRKALEGITRD